MQIIYYESILVQLKHNLFTNFQGQISPRSRYQLFKQPRMYHKTQVSYLFSVASITSLSLTCVMENRRSV